ncbi:hypothetical protein GA0074692_1634 [Micromonospora pallida]|uniref:Uncharacterized protein n=1 Tax=Micromonospora pallida TaxID=145854 RepID=A0A1C6S2R8_9ACTN|nr:hypothetical protein [Micromonospora pallida]SCL23717.1 hypothetical protein GA0074692_1634 [Micromonospora pallida]
MRVDIRLLVRGLFGCLAVAVALVAVVLAVPDPSDPPAVTSWQPPDGYQLADTVSLPDDRRLRLWTGDSGWYVDALRAGRREAGVGARGGGDQYSASEVLGGLVVRVPVAGARTLTVRAAGETRNGTVHAGTVLVPAPPAGVGTVLVTPLGADGLPLGGETVVPIVGRS